MSITAEEVQGFTLKKMPSAEETIADYLDLDAVGRDMEAIRIYWRSPEECPWVRGNWMLDVSAKDGSLLCWRFPAEMTEEFVKKFFAPIVEIDKKRVKEVEQ